MEKLNIIYLRKSREDVDKEDTLENHRNTLVKLCNKNKWDYIILEEVVSSVDLDNRHKLQELINLIEQNKVGRVICMDLDRLSRSNLLSAQLAELFTKYDVKVITPTKEYDFNNDNDTMFADFNGLIARYEYKQIRKRMASGKQVMAESGLWVTGVPPLGYKRNKDTKMLEIVEEEAKVVRYIVECYLSGDYSNHTLAYHLNEISIKGRRGATWDASRLHALMKNKVYIGYIKHKGEWYKGIHEPLITDEEWNLLQQQLKGNRIVTPRKTKHTKKKLSGLVKCGVCGRTMTVIVDYKRGKNFLKCHYKDSQGCRCGNRGIQEQYVINRIEDEILSYIHELEEYAKSGGSDNQQRQISQYNKQIEDIDNQIAKVNNRIANAKEMAKEGILTLSEVKEEIATGELKINKLNEEKAGIKCLIDSLSKNVQEELEGFKYAYDTIVSCRTDEDYNNIIKFIISKVTVTRIENEKPIVEIKFL